MERLFRDHHEGPAPPVLKPTPFLPHSGMPERDADGVPHYGILANVPVAFVLTSGTPFPQSLTLAYRANAGDMRNFVPGEMSTSPSAGPPCARFCRDINISFGCILRETPKHFKILPEPRFLPPGRLHVLQFGLVFNGFNPRGQHQPVVLEPKPFVLQLITEAGHVYATCTLKYGFRRLMIEMSVPLNLSQLTNAALRICPTIDPAQAVALMHFASQTTTHINSLAAIKEENRKRALSGAGSATPTPLPRSKSPGPPVLERVTTTSTWAPPVGTLTTSASTRTSTSTISVPSEMPLLENLLRVAEKTVPIPSASPVSSSSAGCSTSLPNLAVQTPDSQSTSRPHAGVDTPTYLAPGLSAMGPLFVEQDTGAEEELEYVSKKRKAAKASLVSKVFKKLKSPKKDN